MSPPFEIRPFEDGDLDRLLEITVEGFDGASIEQRIDRRLPTMEPPMDWTGRKRQDIVEDVRRHPDGCFVAVSDGEVVGYVTTSLYPDRLQGRIPNLAVDARHRRQGIGRALLERALVDLRARGARVARIETLADNAAGHSLYTSLGFEELVRQVHFALELG